MGRNLYILVADNGRARFFHARTPLEHLEQVREVEHPEGRLTNSQVYSDRPGRQATDYGGSHSFAGEPDTHDAEIFARQLCGFLDEEREAKKFDSLILVAPPRLLGELRRQLGEACGKLVLDSIDKDLVRMPERELVRHLLKHNPGLNSPAARE